MNKYLLFLIIILIFTYQKRDDIRSFFHTPPDYAAAHDVDVIMYGTSWCGYCEKTRVLLNKHGIRYFEYDIESSQEGYKQYRDLGGRGVPVLQINGTIIKGYQPSKILELINDL